MVKILLIFVVKILQVKLSVCYIVKYRFQRINAGIFTYFELLTPRLAKILSFGDIKDIKLGRKDMIK